MESNPYTSPVANLYGAATSTSTDAVSPGTIAQLAGTKPWVQFISVMMWIGAGLMLLVAAGMVLLGTIGGTLGSQIEKSGAFAGAPLLIIGIVYGALAFIYVYPAVKLWAFANRIGSLSSTRSVADLDAALTEQRRFWKFLGIMIIVMFCIYIVLIIGFVAIGATTAMKAGALR